MYRILRGRPRIAVRRGALTTPHNKKWACPKANRFGTGPFCIQTFIIVEAKVNSTVREAASTRVVMMGLAIRAGSR